MTEGKELEGLGGWLILVGLGIILSPLRIVVLIFPIYYKLFSNGSWEVLTTPGNQVYNPLWAPILLGEMTINGALVITWIFIAFLFFTKKRGFPKWYIGVLLFTIAFIIFDSLAAKVLLPNKQAFQPKTLMELGHDFIASLIWIPYMLVSKRVRSTFVK